MSASRLLQQQQRSLITQLVKNKQPTSREQNQVRQPANKPDMHAARVSAHEISHRWHTATWPTQVTPQLWTHRLRLGGQLRSNSFFQNGWGQHGKPTISTTPIALTAFYDDCFPNFLVSHMHQRTIEQFACIIAAIAERHLLDERRRKSWHQIDKHTNKARQLTSTQRRHWILTDAVPNSVKKAEWKRDVNKTNIRHSPFQSINRRFDGFSVSGSSYDVLQVCRDRNSKLVRGHGLHAAV